VPVLAVFGTNDALRVVLFGYACHNTTLAFDKWSGDYAGYAQTALEKNHTGATAMFFNGCGGDQNPLPRRTPELAEHYGGMLAAAVEQTLKPKTPGRHWPNEAVRAREGQDVGDPSFITAMTYPPSRLVPLEPRLKTSLEMPTLNFGPAPSETELQAMATNNASHKRYADRLLNELKSGKSWPRTYPYPIQVWSLGGATGQKLITLGGEPVVDYSIKFKHQFGPRIWVAGYCNDVMTYIPSLRVLKEGGYEGGGAMVPYGQPALRWGDDVEDLLSSAVTRLMKAASH
jgi:hypothetical protein